MRGSSNESTQIRADSGPLRTGSECVEMVASAPWPVRSEVYQVNVPCISKEDNFDAE